MDLWWKFFWGLGGFILALALAIGVKWAQRETFKNQLRPAWAFEILADLLGIGICFAFAWAYYQYYWAR